MSDPSPKVIQIRSAAKTIQLVPYWPDNAETWFQIAESDFCEHGITDQRSQFLAVIHALPREFSRCVTLQMSVSNSYELLKASILKRNVLTDRQRLDELFRNIELGDQSAVSMLARMKEIIGQSATGTGQETNEARDPTNNTEEAMYRHPISIGRQTSRLSIKPLGRFFSPIREPSRFFYFRLVMS
ncbi:unnamed protein product [Trichobilharzia szidati]|nr:unnamed protein product [Trichobilharzia szidati]